MFVDMDVDQCCIDLCGEIYDLVTHEIYNGIFLAINTLPLLPVIRPTNRQDDTNSVELAVCVACESMYN